MPESRLNNVAGRSQKWQRVQSGNDDLSPIRHQILLATILNKESVISQLESDLQSTKKDLESVKQLMKGMTSPRSRDVMEKGFNDEVGGLEGELSAADANAVQLRDRLSEKEEERRALEAVHWRHAQIV